ncbi:hypothetical protein B0H14DRAFT_2580660 [Mycena olivaceomarginata]|nr:hypothetical protein B0H14DRAFT_2580660 [Mycena olivaceomarginata]
MVHTSTTEYKNRPYADPPHRELLEAQALVRRRPLQRGDEFDLELAVPSKNPDPFSRPVPFIPVAPTTRFRLSDGLQTGVGHFSQIWTARIVATPETTLIFKIIQPSMCYCDGDWKNRVHPDDVAGNEAWTYAQLKEKQGLCIPYFLGLHQIVTPSQEHAWVLVLEHIPGPTLTEVTRSKSWDNIHRSEITSLGLFLHDIRGPNFIVTDGQVVRIDFQPMTVIAPTYDLVHVTNMRQLEFFNVVLDHFSEEDCEKMLSWARDKFPAGKHIWG